MQWPADDVRVQSIERDGANIHVFSGSLRWCSGFVFIFFITHAFILSQPVSPCLHPRLFYSPSLLSPSSLYSLLCLHPRLYILYYVFTERKWLN